VRSAQRPTRRISLWCLTSPLAGRMVEPSPLAGSFLDRSIKTTNAEKITWSEFGPFAQLKKNRLYNHCILARLVGPRLLN
jgi:hypothetical protein